jgi:site-specific DNA-cytosine methylase
MRGFGDYADDDTASAIKARDWKDATDLVTQPFTSTSHAQYAEGVGTLRANGGDLAGGSETLLVRPIGFSHTQGLSAQPSEAAFPTLRREDSGMPVAYDEYNDTLGGDVHHALRAGTKQSTGVLTEAAGFKPGQSAKRGIGYQEEVSPTLEAGGGGNNTPAVLQTMTVRRLTPLECERLMGWPDNWTAGQSDTHRYKQCGNGVASPVAEWIGRQLINL